MILIIIIIQIFLIIKIMDSKQEMNMGIILDLIKQQINKSNRFYVLILNFEINRVNNFLINKWDESQSVLEELIKEGKIRTEREKK